MHLIFILGTATAVSPETKHMLL